MMMQSARQGGMCMTCKVILHSMNNAEPAPRLPEQFQMVLPHRCSCSARMLLWMRPCLLSILESGHSRVPVHKPGSR